MRELCISGPTTYVFDRRDADVPHRRRDTASAPPQPVWHVRTERGETEHPSHRVQRGRADHRRATAPRTGGRSWTTAFANAAPGIRVVALARPHVPAVPASAQSLWSSSPHTELAHGFEGGTSPSPGEDHDQMLCHTTGLVDRCSLKSFVHGLAKQTVRPPKASRRFAADSVLSAHAPSPRGTGPGRGGTFRGTATPLIGRVSSACASWFASGCARERRVAARRQSGGLGSYGSLVAAAMNCPRIPSVLSH